MSSVYITILHCLHEIKNQAIILINSIKRDQRLVYPKVQPYLDQFICSSVTNSFWASIAERNLEIIYRKAIARVAQKKLMDRVAQKGGVITIWDVCAKITRREETEVEKARKALE